MWSNENRNLPVKEYPKELTELNMFEVQAISGVSLG